MRGDPSFLRFRTADEPGPPPPLVLVAFVFPALAGFNFGFDIGSTSGAIRQLGLVDPSITESPLLTGLLTSGSLFGTVIGVALSFVVASSLGRRGELLLASALYSAGTLMAICVSADAASLLGIVFSGRVIYGVGIAFAMHSAPVYIAEIAPPSIRGLLISLKEGFIVLGILAGFAATALATNHALAPGIAFRAIWSPPLVLSVLVFVGMLAMPRSPRWLMLRALQKGMAGDGAAESGPSSDGARSLYREARLSLRRLRSRHLGSVVCDEESVDLELHSIVDALRSEEVVGGALPGGDSDSSGDGSGGGGGGGEAGCDELMRSRRGLVAGLGLVLLQQVTGQPSVLYYQESIFVDAGFGALASNAAVIVGGAKLLATLFTVFQVENYGRRPLLFAGISMMLVSLVLLTSAFYLRPLGDTDAVPGAGDRSLSSFVIVGALMVYVCGYQIGFGPIAWLMISEVFPLRTRGTALSIAVAVNFGCNLLVTFTLPSIQTWFDALDPGRGIAYLFATYAALCVASLAFVQHHVPETRGKTLEQIEAELRD